MTITVDELIHLTLLATGDVAMRAGEAERSDRIVPADHHGIVVAAAIHYLAQLGAIKFDALDEDPFVPIFLNDDGKAAVEARFAAAGRYMAAITAALP